MSRTRRTALPRPATKRASVQKVEVAFTNGYPDSRFSNWTRIDFPTAKLARKFLRKQGLSIKDAKTSITPDTLHLIINATYKIPAKDQVRVHPFDLAALIAIGYETSGDFDEAIRIYKERVDSFNEVAQFPPMKELRSTFRKEFKS